MSVFRFRPATVRDLPRCVAFTGIHRTIPTLDEARCAILLVEGRLICYVFEEYQPDGTFRIWGAGFSGLVDADVAVQAMTGRVGEIVARLIGPRTKRPWRLLSFREQVTAAKKGGLHAFVLGSAIDSTPQCPTAEIISLAQKSFLHAHSGYPLQSLLSEVDERLPAAAAYRASLLAMGCEAAPKAHGSPTQVLFITARSMMDKPYHILQPVFRWAPPCIALTRAQRLQAELTLLGYEDHEIKQLMQVNGDTVAKRWRQIFERVEQRLPGLLWPPRKRPGRGQTKRRRLISYIAHHPEELRVFAPWCSHK